MKNLPQYPKNINKAMLIKTRDTKNDVIPDYLNGRGGLPKHLVAIPDGNRRWAKERGLVPWEGHREGVKKFWEVCEEAFDMGVPYFTFWAASEDNLKKRSRIEVKFLVLLLKKEVFDKSLFARLEKDEMRLRVFGRWNEILKDKKLEETIRDLEKKTAKFEKHNLTILFGYDGKREMIEAIEALRRTKEINYEKVKQSLWTGDLPPVDYVIRTGGEPHWSAGFMMWLTADSQFYFTEKLWPDFGEKELHKALEEYSLRERRMGG